MLHVGFRLWTSALNCWRRLRDRSWTGAKGVRFQRLGSKNRVRASTLSKVSHSEASFDHGIMNCSKHCDWSYLFIKHSTKLSSECSSKHRTKGSELVMLNSLWVLMRSSLITDTDAEILPAFPANARAASSTRAKPGKRVTSSETLALVSERVSFVEPYFKRGATEFANFVRESATSQKQTHRHRNSSWMQTRPFIAICLANGRGR